MYGQSRQYNNPNAPPFRAEEDVQSDERFYESAASQYRNVLDFRQGSPYPDAETNDNERFYNRNGDMGPRNRLPVWR